MNINLYPADLGDKIMAYYYSLVFNSVILDLKNNSKYYRDRYFVYTDDTLSINNKQQVTSFDWEYDIHKSSNMDKLLIVSSNDSTMKILRILNSCKICSLSPRNGKIVCKRCIPSRKMVNI